MRVIDSQTIELHGDLDAVLVLVGIRSHLLAELREASVAVLLRQDSAARIKAHQELPRWRHLIRFCRQLAARRGERFDGVVAPLAEAEDAVRRLEQAVGS